MFQETISQQCFCLTFCTLDMLYSCGSCNSKGGCVRRGGLYNFPTRVLLSDLLLSFSLPCLSPFLHAPLPPVKPGSLASVMQSHHKCLPGKGISTKKYLVFSLPLCSPGILTCLFVGLTLETASVQHTPEGIFLECSHLSSLPRCDALS